DSILSTKDFVLYTLKFIKQWHGNYLRRGAKIMTGDVVRNVTRYAAYVENDELNKLNTRSLHSTNFPVQFKDAEGGNICSCTLLVDFDEEGKCTISTNTTGYTATGTASFVTKGEKNSWGNKDRDALYLDYQVTYRKVFVGSCDNTRSIRYNNVINESHVMHASTLSS